MIAAGAWERQILGAWGHLQDGILAEKRFQAEQRREITALTVYDWRFEREAAKRIGCLIGLAVADCDRDGDCGHVLTLLCRCLHL